MSRRMLPFLLALFSTLPLRAQVALVRQELQAPGRVNHVASRDLDGDGTAELLVITRQGTDENPIRRLLYWTPGADGFKPQPTQSLDLPADAVIVDACDVGLGPGMEILLLTDQGLSAFVRSAPGPYPSTPQAVLPLPATLPFPDEEDAPFYDMCHTPKGGSGVELWVPGGRGVSVVRPAESGLAVQEQLIMRPKAYHLSGDEFRGPRARRDFAVLTTLVMPKLVSLDADKDGDDDLYALVEDTVSLYVREGGKLSTEPVVRRNFNLRNATDRAKRNAVMDVMLGDISGDGLPDAVVTKLAGGMTSLKTETRLYLGTGKTGFEEKPVGTRRADGYATPLAILDLEGDGKLEVLEPQVGTAPMTVAGMLIKQRVDVDVRVLRSHGRDFYEGKDMTVSFSLDTSGAGGVKGSLPLLGQDVDGDGLKDIISLGTGHKVELLRGIKSDPPFEEDESWSGSVPSTLRAEWYVPRPGSPASVVVFFPTKGNTGTMVVFFNLKGAK
ncbi:MAG: hypothetical protein AB2A00_16350 [Myxococcota bacterium]